VGVSFLQLLDAGYDLKRMKREGFTAAELGALGADLPALVAAGYCARELKSKGFTLSQLLEAGYDLKRMKKEGGFAHRKLVAELVSWGADLAALKAAGFSARMLTASGKFPLSLLIEAGCDFKMMKDEGIRAAELQEVGADLPALLSLGYNVKELKRLAFTPLQWQQAGYDLKRMKKEGFTAAELILRFGSDLRSLVAADYSVTELRGAGVHLSQLAQLVVHPVYELAARCSTQRLKEGWFSLSRGADVLPWYALNIGVSLHQKRTLHTRCSALCLMLIHRLFYLKTDLSANIRNSRMHQLSVASRLIVAGTGSAFVRRMQDAMKVQQFIALGLDFKMLVAGYRVQELKGYGFTLSHWLDAGFDLKWMEEAGFSAAELNALGADLRTMIALGIDPIRSHTRYSIDELVIAFADVTDIIVSCARCLSVPNLKFRTKTKNL